MSKDALGQVSQETACTDMGQYENYNVWIWCDGKVFAGRDEGCVELDNGRIKSFPCKPKRN